DFSGYSDMAIGIGHMLGFDFLENFNYPYVSCSVQEFWRRWHISLSSWFRDYLYIPLGGNRKGTARTYLNLIIVFTATGFWHGASWNFLFWGVWFFVLLTVEKLCFSQKLKALDSLPFYRKIPGWLYAMTAVLLGWVLFRAETLPLALDYFRVMFGIGVPAGEDASALLFLTQKAVFYLAAILFSAPVVPALKEKLQTLRTSPSGAYLAVIADALYPAVMLALFLVCVSYLLKSSYNPFIYFNF
ncbi:MAG: MBOAT family O-acyltransferase, partial [Eubacteriales bacterium]